MMNEFKVYFWWKRDDPNTTPDPNDPTRPNEQP